MSRIGRALITYPESVKIEYKDKLISVSGPLGMLKREIKTDMITILIKNGEVKLERKNDQKHTRALHGLYRALINNMVMGVQNKFKKSLTIEGVGYRCSVNGQKLTMNIGYSHPVEILAPQGIEVVCPSQNEIVVQGIDKEQVGHFASTIKSKRPVEPYHLYGIRYTNEKIIKKEGKKAGK